MPYNGKSFVTGVEADIQGITAGGGNLSKNSLYPGPFNSSTLNLGGLYNASDNVWNNVSGSASLQYLRTVRGRVGYLFTPTLLVYGMGGLAYGGVSINFNQSQYHCHIIGAAICSMK